MQTQHLYETVFTYDPYYNTHVMIKNNYFISQMKIRILLLEPYIVCQYCLKASRCDSDTVF